MLLRCHIGSWCSLSLHLAALSAAFQILLSLIFCVETQNHSDSSGVDVLPQSYTVSEHSYLLLILCGSQICLFEYFLSLFLMKLWLVINTCHSIPFHVFHLFVSLPHAGQWLKNFSSDQPVFFSPVSIVPFNLPTEFLILIFTFFISTSSIRQIHHVIVC